MEVTSALLFISFVFKNTPNKQKTEELCIHTKARFNAPCNFQWKAGRTQPWNILISERQILFQALKSYSWKLSDYLKKKKRNGFCAIPLIPDYTTDTATVFFPHVWQDLAVAPKLVEQRDTLGDFPRKRAPLPPHSRSGKGAASGAAQWYFWDHRPHLCATEQESAAVLCLSVTKGVWNCQ